MWPAKQVGGEPFGHQATARVCEARSGYADARDEGRNRRCNWRQRGAAAEQQPVTELERARHDSIVMTAEGERQRGDLLFVRGAEPRQRAPRFDQLCIEVIDFGQWFVSFAVHADGDFRLHHLSQFARVEHVAERIVKLRFDRGQHLLTVVGC